MPHSQSQTFPRTSPNLIKRLSAPSSSTSSNEENTSLTTGSVSPPLGELNEEPITEDEKLSNGLSLDSENKIKADEIISDRNSVNNKKSLNNLNKRPRSFQSLNDISTTSSNPPIARAKPVGGGNCNTKRHSASDLSYLDKMKVSPLTYSLQNFKPKDEDETSLSSTSSNKKSKRKIIRGFFSKKYKQ